MFVRKFPRQTLLTLLTAALILTACNVGTAPAPTLDVNAINTAIVGTTVAQFSAQFTQTALAVPPTPIPTNTPVPLPTLGLATANPNALPTISFDTTGTTPIGGTPLPGFTPLASPASTTKSLGDSCNNSVFEGDVTIPDGSILKPGEDFKKVWAIRNTGTCTWDDGYALVFIGGNQEIDPYNFEFKKSSDFVSSGQGVNIGINLTAPLKEGKYEGHWRMRNDQGYYFGTVLSVYIEVRKP